MADTGADTGTDTGTDMSTDTGDASDTVLVTIAKAPDGGYMVYSGDEPDDNEGAEGEAGAAGGAADAGAAGAGAAGGQHCDSIGAALKAAMDILQESENSAGETGSSEDQFTGGYGGDKGATPAAARPGRGGMKFPPAAAA
jgi:hypothetical protein